MKRDKKVKDGEVRWQKLGGGSCYLRLDGKVKMIKPGQIFTAKPDDIPEGFRDIIVPVEPAALRSVQDKEPKKKAASVYTRTHKGGGKYIVEDEKGKKINEGYLTKDEAKELIETLS